MEIIHTSSQIKSASLSLFFFQTANSTWLYLPGKWKNENMGCRTMLLKAVADQGAFAYEWCGNDVPASQRLNPLPRRTYRRFLGGTGTGPIYPASPQKCPDRLTSPLQLPLPPQTENKVFLKGWVRRDGRSHTCLGRCQQWKHPVLGEKQKN